MVASRAVAGGGAGRAAQCKPGGVCGTDVLREDKHENANHSRRIGDRDCHDRGTRAGELHAANDLYPGRAYNILYPVLLQRALYHDVSLASFLAGFELLP